MKKKNKLLLIAVIGTLIIPAITVFAASTASGNFSLSYMQYEKSSYATLQASYPYVIFTPQNTESTTLKITLSKKAYMGLGITNVQTKLTDFYQTSKIYTYFTEQTSGKDYLVTIVNNASTGYANAKYKLTSKSTYGTD
jgi:hypothetical protein